MTDTATPTPAPCPQKSATVVFVTAEGTPDAWVNGTDIEINITGYGRPVEATIVVPLDQAQAWAADVYAAVTIAHREHTSTPMTDGEPATQPDGPLIDERLADHGLPD